MSRQYQILVFGLVFAGLWLYLGQWNIPYLAIYKEESSEQQLAVNRTVLSRNASVILRVPTSTIQEPPTYHNGSNNYEDPTRSTVNDDITKQSKNVNGNDDKVQNAKSKIQNIATSVSISSSVSTTNDFLAPPSVGSKNILTCPTDNIFLYYMDRSTGQGFGSLTLNMMWIGLYFEQTRNLSLVVDERGLQNYRYNETHGVYQGFYEHNFCIVQHEEYYTRSNNSFCVKDLECSSSNNRNGNNSNHNIQILPLQPPNFFTARRHAKQHFRNNRTQLYELLSEYTCRHLPRLRLPIQRQVDELLQLLPKKENNNNMTVAFHIRRGDKKKEVEPMPATEYVNTFIKAAANNNVSTQSTQHCFVATDDYRVVNELQMALNQSNIPCQLWTLTQPEYRTTRSRDDFILFLAQLQVLCQAEYFVGTFTSNIGGLVTLVRGCSRNGGKISDDFHHYYESYGVDYERWRIV